jgi:hypothetical protein
MCYTIIKGENMERTLSVDRLFSVGQFNNIRFSDTISGLPEYVAVNPDLLNKLRFLQLVQIELDFRKYLKLMDETGALSIDESIKLLNDLREGLIKNLLKTKEENLTEA